MRFLRILTLVVLTSSLGLSQKTLSQEASFTRETPLVKTVRETQSAVAAVYVRKGNSQSSGSGSVIDPRGYVLTAKHVVGDDHVILLRGRPPMRAKLIGTMPEYDLAILKLGQQAFNRPASPRYPMDGTPLTFLRIGLADELMLGESILNIGNPGGRGIVVTRGIVSSLGIYGGNALGMATQSSNGFNQLLQFDAASNPGNSGGPLINANSQQVGLVSSSIRGEEGIHFAIPLMQIRDSISQMLYSEFRHRYVSGILIDHQDANVVVTTVEPDSPAQAAGLEVGDQITAIDGRTLRDPIDWEFSRYDWRAGQSISLDILRDGKSIQSKLTLAKRLPTPAIENVETQPGLLCYAAPYDPQIGEPLDDDDKPSQRPMVESVVNATPSGLAQSSHYELIYDGFLKIEQSGVHRVAIKSDDGSRLYVHDRLVVDNGGNHADQIRTGWIDLAKGLHPIRVEYYEDEGQENLELLIAHGDNDPKPVASNLLFHIQPMSKD